MDDFILEDIKTQEELEKLVQKAKETAKAEGIAEGKKINLAGRTSRETKDLEKKLADAQDKIDKLSESAKLTEDEIKEFKKFQTDKKNSDFIELAKKHKLDINKKYVSDVINKAGITDETKEEDIPALLKKASEDFPELFGEKKTTISFGGEPSPIFNEGNKKTSDLPRTADGKIDTSKITDPQVLKMIEQMN